MRRRRRVGGTSSDISGDLLKENLIALRSRVRLSAYVCVCARVAL